MYNNLLAFIQQQASLSGQRSEKPAFYRDFTLDSQLNGPSIIGPLPSLTRIGPDITFSRNSSATYIDQNGFIAISRPDEPRFEWMNHRTNLLSASNNINSNAWTGYWTKSPDWRQDTTGPDGVYNSAWSLPLSSCIYPIGVPGVNPRFTGIIQSLTNLPQKPLSGTPITVSVWARADDTSYDFVSFGIEDSQSGSINLTTNWQRFSRTGTYRDNRGVQFYAASGTNTNNTSKIYVYGFQCEVGSTATPYISTNTLPVTVSQPRGLLIEETRTNLLPNSENFESADWTTQNVLVSTVKVLAPSNTLTGSIISATNNNGNIYDAAIPVSTGVTTCYSTYLKYRNNDWAYLEIQQPVTDNLTRAWFNIRTGTTGTTEASGQGVFVSSSITSAGNGWYRCVIVGSIAGTNTYTVKIASATNDGSTSSLTGEEFAAWGAQLEIGTTPTSYIPTSNNTGGRQRLADNADVTNSTFATVYNKNEGTLLTEGSIDNPVGAPWLINLHDNTTSNYLGIYTVLPLNVVGNTYRKDGASDTIVSTDQLNLQNENIVRASTAYNKNFANLFVNGQNIGNINLAKYPIKTAFLSLGKLINTNYINGHIRKIGYWPKQLSNNTQRALTLSSIGFAKYFAEDKSLYTGAGPGVEVYRNSQATYFDQNGVLKFAGGDRPRFDHDPITGVCKGLLVEESRTNLLTYSTQLENAVWELSSGSNIAPNNAIAPDNTTTASSVSALAYIRQTPSSINNSTLYTFSVWLQSSTNESQNVILTLEDNGNLSTVVASTTASITSTWQRYSVTGTSASATNLFRVLVGAGRYNIWGPQLEQGGFATSYIPTLNAQVTRAADIVQVNTNSFNTFYNPEQGTFYTRALPLSGAQAAAVLDIGDVNKSFHGIWKSGTGGDGSIGTSWNTFSNATFLSAGAQLTQLTANFVSVSGTGDSGARIAYSYSPLAYNTAVSGTLVTQTTVSALPDINQSNLNFFNGHIQTIEYYNTQLPTTQLTALSN
jgi:hypothetical protein